MSYPQSNNSGFSLISIMIVIAVLAILAGALGPMAFRQIMKARELETLNEMNTIKLAYLDFFHDTGRFPTDAEGIAALITNPGHSQWQGPYLPGEATAALAQFTVDSFGKNYLIDTNPLTDPPGTSELLFISGGIDQSISAGSPGSTWTLQGDNDDLIVLADSGSLNRSKLLQARDEMQAISLAAQGYFYDHAAFPLNLSFLDGSYLDSDFQGGAFVDPWNSSYTIDIDNTAQPPVLTVRSPGPNQISNSGSGDDLSLQVGSAGPGRQSTHYMLSIIQGAVNNNAGTGLTGDWDIDRETFNLLPAFTNDGWGNPYEEAMSTRTILSGGPDADYFTGDDNIPVGVVPDDEGGIEPWDSFGSYTIGDIVSHNGSNWECRQSHNCAGDPNWAPGIAHSLWLLI